MLLARQATSAFMQEYKKTPVRLQLIDLFLIFHLLTAFLQCVYAGLVGTFPFNSFLAGLLSCIGSFVLTVSLRMQINPENKDFKAVLPERAFAEYVVCNLLLHFVVMNSIG
mmetsp:Transcript_45115/g.75271  ORF Transcript_45115/g.75271 Transcript_45115/m.75271 type:complete len:111 (-) Transcript_45115:115-447(-)